jgi:hypothetical protein
MIGMRHRLGDGAGPIMDPLSFYRRHPQERKGGFQLSLE